jgi:hypothetical protein
MSVIYCFFCVLLGSSPVASPVALCCWVVRALRSLNTAFPWWSCFSYFTLSTKKDEMWKKVITTNIKSSLGIPRVSCPCRVWYWQNNYGFNLSKSISIYKRIMNDLWFEIFDIPINEYVARVVLQVHVSHFHKRRYMTWNRKVIPQD